MSFKTDGLAELTNEFMEIANRIENNNAKNKLQNVQQSKIEIIEAYNNIIKFARPVWQSTSTQIREYVKAKLIEIYHELREILQILNVEIKWPANLSEEIELNNSKTETKETQTEELNEKQPDNILKSTNDDIDDELQAMYDEFMIWYKKNYKKKCIRRRRQSRGTEK